MTLEELTSKQNKKKLTPPEPPKVKYKVKSKKKWFYIVPIINIVGSLLVFAILWFTNVPILYLILYGIVVFPFFFFSGIAFFIRLYLDKEKIKGTITKKLAKNYVIAKIFRENKRNVEIVRMIKPDKTFDWNKGTYTVDLEAVWFDNDNRPCSFYIEGLPNPILFGFQKDIKRFLSSVMTENPQDILDEGGMPIDLSFSSTTLQMLKKDKIFAELQRNPESEKLVMMLIGVVTLALVVIGISFFFGGGK